MNTVPRVAESMDDLQVGMLIASVLPGDNRQEVYGGTIEAIDGDYAILVQPSFSGKFQTVRFHDPPHSVVILADPPALVDAVERPAFTKTVGEDTVPWEAFDETHPDYVAHAAPPSEPLCRCGHERSFHEPPKYGWCDGCDCEGFVQSDRELVYPLPEGFKFGGPTSISDEAEAMTDELAAIVRRHGRIERAPSQRVWVCYCGQRMDKGEPLESHARHVAEVLTAAGFRAARQEKA